MAEKAWHHFRLYFYREKWTGDHLSLIHILDKEKASDNLATTNFADYEKDGKTAKYSQAWRYFNSVEDGSRVSKGWFKVVAAEYLNKSKYDDDEDAWYYACLLYTSRCV